MNIAALHGTLWIFWAAFFCSPALLVAGGDSLESRVDEKRNRAEVRLGDGGFTMEYRRYWLPSLSSDLWISTMSVQGGGIALSFEPFPIILIQGSLGLSSYTEQITDASPFDADYVYGVRGGVLVPLGQLPVYISISGGYSWMVDTRYCRDCGGFIVPERGVGVTPTYRTETRRIDLFQLGLGARF